MRLSRCQAQDAWRPEVRVVGNLQQSQSTQESDLTWCSMKPERTGKTHSAVAEQRAFGEHRHGIEIAAETMLASEHMPGGQLGCPCPESEEASIVTTPSTE